MPPKERFSTLDGIRGAAAISVMMYHSGQAFGSGYLGVDVFFLLSGFVLSQVYRDRLLAGMPVWRFAALRLVRIYPLCALGIALGIVVGGGGLTGVLLPGFDRGNPPLWSLVFEVAVNLAWAAALPAVSERGRVAFLLASGAFVAWGILAIGPGALAGPVHLALTTARVAFSYALGCQFDALYRRAPRQRTTRLAWLPLAALALLMAPRPGNAAAWDLFALFVAIPAIVWFGIAWRAPREGVMDTLGRLSFPLYCIHAPVILACLGSPVRLGLAVLGLIPAAILLGQVDGPMQRALRRLARLDGRPASRVAPA